MTDCEETLIWIADLDGDSIVDDDCLSVSSGIKLRVTQLSGEIHAEIWIVVYF